jgi:hypothetical protein
MSVRILVVKKESAALDCAPLTPHIAIDAPPAQRGFTLAVPA